MASSDETDRLRRLQSGLPILIVDDYAEMRGILRGMLSGLGCTEIREDDGRRALALLHEREHGLIISDLYMQPTSGLELLKAVRADRFLAPVPFIMVTGAATRDDVIAAKQLDVDGYLAKPFTTAMLAQQMSAALRRDGPTRSVPPESGEPAELRTGIAVLMSVIERRLAAAELLIDDQTIQLLRSYLERATELGLAPRHAVSFARLCSALCAAIGSDVGPSHQRIAPNLLRPEIRPAARRELRRYCRFSAPALQAALHDRIYRTADWSVGGLAIAGYSGPLMPGRQIETRIRIEGSEPNGAVFSDVMTVVRNNIATGRLSAKFMPRSWTGFKLLEQLIHRRIGANEGGDVAA